MEMSVRVRFAPSPTGPLHIGGLRTALFNYLFARKHKGTFILRIEDTDQSRFVPGTEEYITESLRWCHLDIDEGPARGGPYQPYRQSERKNLYRQYANLLLQSGNAYLAFDTPEEIEQYRKQAESEDRTFQYDMSVRNKLKNSLSLDETEVKRLINSGAPYVIRFKMPENEEVRINDLIRGEVSFHTSTLDDKVLFKSDGLPTYHLANVTDDYMMKITHVIRGEEWLPSLPLHVLLYKAFGWEEQMPRFAHLPLILKPGGQGKLSKRDGDKMGFPVFPLQWKDPNTGELSSGYRESGYFPEAVVNMLALLGWNPGTDQEIFSLDELAEVFSLDRVGKAGARFDPEKVKWYNQQYLKQKSENELTAMLTPLLESKGIKADFSALQKAVGLVKERATFVADLWKEASFFFVPPQEYDQATVKKVWREGTASLMKDVIKLLSNPGPFSNSGIESAIKDYAEKHQIGMGKIMNPLRLLLVGGSFGPHLIDIMVHLGKEETLRRIDTGIKIIE
ncbi:MAG: glutamate--tRNA ligase [Bacteroidales bacterium]|nr:glutamate--tRNA ligase [Bacteroidales bacterium]MBN2763970.1 glutamate--tRNA ligase [Bacteroidales bacterium]